MALLELSGVAVRYGASPVLQGIDLHVDAGEVVALFGRNGAGKTTTLRTIMGWLRPSAGRITLEGEPIGGLSPDRICRRGVGYIPEDRRIFPTLSVEENLKLGLFQRPRLGAAARRDALEAAYETFPHLKERRRQAGRTLSGGEQQMLAIGRALIGRPRLLLVDEPSEGLAPMLVARIFDAIRAMRDEGVAVLMVEQNVRGAAGISDRCYVIEKGRQVAEGTPSEILGSEELRRKLAV